MPVSHPAEVLHPTHRATLRVVAWSLAGLLLASAAAHAATAAALINDAQAALKKLYAKVPAAKALQAKAYAGHQDHPHPTQVAG